MRTKEEYYEQVLKNRALAADPEVTRCTCPNTLCEWHQRCRECVALHRHYNDHVPACLRPVIAGRLGALAAAAEMTLAEKEGTPVKYRHYVRERDAQTARGDD